MKKSILIFLILLGPLMGLAGQKVIVSAGGKLTVFLVGDDGLTVDGTIDLPGNSGPFGISTDGRFLYANTSLEVAGSKKPVPAVATFSVSTGARLTLLETAPSLWNSGYLSPESDGRFFAGNSYGQGKVGVWALDEDRVYRGAEPFEFELEKKAHAAVFSPDNRFLFVPATGPNKVFQLVFNGEKGTVHPNQPSSAPGSRNPEDARQPRHIVFHPELGMAYTTNEREHPGAGAWRFDREKGVLESVQAVRSVPGDDEGMTTADLHLSPDGKFLYVSNRDIKNRNNPDEGRDAIALFSVNQADGLLTFVQTFPCEKIPRSFAVGLEGKRVFVSGQGDQKLGDYLVDQESGHLTRMGRHDLPGVPSWVSVIDAE